jgi:hypothetical protein
MTSVYERVLLTSIYDKIDGNGLSRNPIYSVDEYNEKFEQYNRKGGICELVGIDDYQVKPYFDLDPKEEFDYNIIDEVKLKINEIIKSYTGNDVDIYEARREPREEFGVLKHSIRLYPAVRCLYQNIPIIFNPVFDEYPFIDKRIYNRNRRLYCSNNNRKRDLSVPPLKTIHGTVLDCCATYIKEDYPDLDKFVKVVDEPIVKYSKIKIQEEEEDFSNEFNYDKIKSMIDHFISDRAKEYGDWCEVCFTIFGMCKRSNISRTATLKLIHHFSKKSNDKYDEYKVDEWIDINYNRSMNTDNTFGFKQAFNYLKIDDKEYYDMNYNDTYEAVKKRLEKELIKADIDGCFIIINNDRDEIDDAAFHIVEPSRLIHIYRDKFFYYKKTVKGDTTTYKRVPIINQWLDDENKRRCHSLCFRPSELPSHLNNKYFNMFKGFRAQLLPVCKDYSKIQRILNHIKEVMSNNNDEVYKYVLQWFKHILQGKRTNVMIMIKGKEGCGKNILLNMFAEGIIGKEYSVASSNPDKQLFGQFNSGLQNRLLAIVNEGQRQLRDCMDRIKDFITEDNISIERKGKDPITLKNTTNFIGDTNNFNILNISPDDRRFVWLECNDKYIGNKQYFDPLADECENDESMSAFYHYLLEEVEDNIDLQKTRPITKIYRKIQNMNLSNITKFLRHLNNEGIKYRKHKDCAQPFKTIPEYELYCEYKTFSMSRGYTAYQYDQFEAKILESSIQKVTYQKQKKFRIYKNDFETYMSKFNQLEELEEFNIDENSGEFIDDDE